MNSFYLMGMEKNWRILQRKPGNTYFDTTKHISAGKKEPIHTSLHSFLRRKERSSFPHIFWQPFYRKTICYYYCSVKTDLYCPSIQFILLHITAVFPQSSLISLACARLWYNGRKAKKIAKTNFLSLWSEKNAFPPFPWCRKHYPTMKSVSTTTTYETLYNYEPPLLLLM